MNPNSIYKLKDLECNGNWAAWRGILLYYLRPSGHFYVLKRVIPLAFDYSFYVFPYEVREVRRDEP